MPYYQNALRGRYQAGGYYMPQRPFVNPPRAATVNETELASTTLQVQLKRIYVDVKQNERGRFVKISHGIPGEQKNRIAFPFEAAYQLRRVLQSLAELEQTLATKTDAAKPNASPYLRTETIVFNERKYFLDFRENQHGRFLRIHQQTVAAAPRAMYGAVTPRGPVIIVPSPGISELAKLVDEYLTTYFAKELENYKPPPESQQGATTAAGGAGSAAPTGEASKAQTNSEDALPSSTTLKSGNKTFYFDVGRNSRGIFLRITEMSPRMRSSITVPLKSWSQFGTTVAEYVTKCATQIAELNEAEAAATKTGEATEDASEKTQKKAAEADADEDNFEEADAGAIARRTLTQKPRRSALRLEVHRKVAAHRRMARTTLCASTQLTRDAAIVRQSSDVRHVKLLNTLSRCTMAVTWKHKWRISVTDRSLVLR